MKSATSRIEHGAQNEANDKKELDQLEVLINRYKKTPPETPEEVYEHLGADLRYWELNLRRKHANQALGAMAHSRPALAIHAPAFFRHAMYFFPQSGREKNPLMHQGDFRREHALDDIRRTLVKLTSRDSIKDLSDEITYRFNKDESIVYVLDGFMGFELRAVVDVYSEYATVSLVLDNNKRFAGEEFRSNPEAIAGEIQHAISKRKNQVPWKRKSDDEGPQFEKTYSASAACFFGIWELLNSERGTRFSSVRNMVADFRGFALVPEGHAVDYSENPGKAKKGIKTNRDDDDRYQVVPHPPQQEQNVLAFFESRRDFFLECLGLSTSGELLYETHGKTKRIEPNVILCRMLGGDAIYGSSLGSTLTFRDREVPHPNAPKPVAYFIIHNGQSANQLGRMIRRQNLLGELRIAALFDADLIVKLGSAVRRLSGLVTTLLEDCTKGAFVDDVRFRQVLEIYAAIGRSCHGGFSYRMSRANYYYDALQERLDDTRSKPIWGWQSYSGFINRHFDQRFRSMRSVGERYSEVGARIQQLFALYGTETRHRSALVALTATLSVASFGIARAIDQWAEPAIDQWAHSQQIILTTAAKWGIFAVIYLLVLIPALSVAFYFFLHPRARHLRSHLRVKVRWHHWVLFVFTATVAIGAALYLDIGAKLATAWSALKALLFAP